MRDVTSVGRVVSFLSCFCDAVGYLIPGKHVVYDESETIDLDNVPLEGGVLLKMINFSIDPYLRHKMIEKELRPHEAIVSAFVVLSTSQSIHQINSLM